TTFAITSLSGALAVVSAQGCSSDSTPAPTSSSSGGSSSGASSSGASSSGASSSGASSSGASSSGASSSGASSSGDAGSDSGGKHPTADECKTWCATEIKTCPTVYKDADTCQTTCVGWNYGTAGDQSGNTFQCRVYHQGAAGASADAAKTHCPHTGDG